MDVEADTGPVKDFIHTTNLLVLVGHGATALGRALSQAYHPLNSFTSEVRRNIETEKLATINSKRCAYRSRAEIETHREAAAE